MFRRDPGPCGICGAAHSTCKPAGSSTRIEIAQTPMRDARAAGNLPPVPLVAETKSEQIGATLPEGQFTTATYRGRKKP